MVSAGIIPYNFVDLWRVQIKINSFQTKITWPLQQNLNSILIIFWNSAFQLPILSPIIVLFSGIGMLKILLLFFCNCLANPKFHFVSKTRVISTKIVWAFYEVYTLEMAIKVLKSLQFWIPVTLSPKSNGCRFN